ncbi:glycine cleavage system aminomethyltransferase GcvT [Bacteroidota bacterium]
MELKQTALTEVHIGLGARMVPFAGYNMPVRYSSDIEEHQTVRNGVGVFDVSHMGEFMIEGPEALDLIQYVTSNDASKLINGQVQYSCLPNEDGGIVDDLLVYRFDDEKFMLVVNASNIEKDWNWISKNNSYDASMENISDKITLLAIQGPDAINVLQKITASDLASMQYYTFKKGNIGDITDGAIISATGYTGAGGFEVYVYNEFARNIWNMIFEAGKEFNIKPIGLGARDTLRLDMGYCLYGNDIDDTTSPIEAGLGWITKFTKEFINKDFIVKQKEEGIQKRLVGFKMIDKGIPRNGYDILNNSGEKIGSVTSGTQSPSMGIGIGLGYVAAEYKAPGTEVIIGIRSRQLKAEVVKLPIYKG